MHFPPPLLFGQTKATASGTTPRVMDLGCGWGSLTLFVATRYPNIQVFSVSNSRTQKEYIMSEAKRRGLTNVQVQTADAAEFDTTERFDRVLSVEMFEHMKNYDRLLRKVKSWLRPGGKVFVHIFTHSRFAYHFEDDDGWMAENFFSGGQMPSDDLLLYFQRDLNVTGHWRVDGTHYKKTCDAWLQKLDAHRQEALTLFRDTDAPSPLKQLVNWRIFFIACGESFAYNGGKDWAVSHYLFERPEDLRKA
jgi:cyclopropane-fatty-acyl-phospholipid synthase